MKNLFISSFSFFMVLFLFSFVSLILLSGGNVLAQAITSCTGTGTDCNTRLDQETCEAVDDCSWSHSKFTDTICNIFNIATGNGGKAFAAFAIISIGIGFFTGKVSWGLMIAVAAGIAAMFGAPSIVSAISGEESFDCGA